MTSFSMFLLLVGFGLGFLFAAAVMRFAKRERHMYMYSQRGAMIMGLSLIAGTSSQYLVPLEWVLPVTAVFCLSYILGVRLNVGARDAYRRRETENATGPREGGASKRDSSNRPGMPSSSSMPRGAADV